MLICISFKKGRSQSAIMAIQVIKTLGGKARNPPDPLLVSRIIFGAELCFISTGYPYDL